MLLFVSLVADVHPPTRQGEYAAPSPLLRRRSLVLMTRFFPDASLLALMDLYFSFFKKEDNLRRKESGVFPLGHGRQGSLKKGSWLIYLAHVP